MLAGTTTVVRNNPVGIAVLIDWTEEAEVGANIMVVAKFPFVAQVFADVTLLLILDVTAGWDEMDKLGGAFAGAAEVTAGAGAAVDLVEGGTIVEVAEEGRLFEVFWEALVGATPIVENVKVVRI